MAPAHQRGRADERPLNAHNASMSNQVAPTGGDKAPLYALAGTILVAIGGMLFVNLDEDPEIFIVFSVIFAGPGLYLLIAGAVARGISIGRR